MYFILKQVKNSTFNFSFLLVALISIGCQEKEILDVLLEPQSLVRYEKLREIEKDQLEALIQISGYDIDTSLIRFDIEVYQIVYKTILKDEVVEASGLLALPLKTFTNVPILMSFSPSLSSASDTDDMDDGLSDHTELLSTLGFISLIPDNIGLGASSKEVYPYLIKEASVQNSLDLLKAASEMLDKIRQPYDRSLLLLGYSQGAYQAMATLEALELFPQNFWEPEVAMAGGGPYNLQTLGREIASQDQYASPELLAYLIAAYHLYYEWPGSLEQYFRQPYADFISSGYNGELSLEYIKSQLTTDLSLLLQADFLDALRQGSNNQLEEALVSNSIHPWRIKANVRGYHVPSDKVIPVKNSRQFYSKMEELQPAKVSYIEMEEATGHVNGGITMLEDVLPWLISIYGI